MELSVLPLHKHPEYLQACCDLLNSEWKRSNTARLRSLEGSCDYLPVSLILLKNEKLIGHLKLTSIPSNKNACFVESVVIESTERTKGYGSTLMNKAEQYCREHLKLNVAYLSTKGQEKFYSKLGYIECAPISIYGSYVLPKEASVTSNNKCKPNSGPPPPPMPSSKLIIEKSVTYMKKDLT